jgi:crotonobetainyl-CoA:carnitine CoA-transferase CaiB-like acyl-CoA transferase
MNDDAKPPAAGLLADVTVVEISTLIAGPGCARYFADYGARVVKVERPGPGDTLRRVGERDPADEVALFFKLHNRGKVGVRLDLKSDEGCHQLLKLIDQADVLIENLRPGTLERMRLGPDVLFARAPHLVLTRISAFGQDGPYSARPGFATLAEAMSGFAYLNGEPDGPPILPPVAVTDEVTALVAFSASLVALHAGGGQVVDVNLLESMMGIMGPTIPAAALLGTNQQRLGSGLPYSVPRGVYQTLDGQYVAISASSDGVARRIFEVVGLGDDPELMTSAGRIAHREKVDSGVGRWVSERPLTEVLQVLQRADAAVAPIMSPTDLVNDRHVVARGAVVEVGGIPMQGPVARFSSGMSPLRGPFVETSSADEALAMLEVRPDSAGRA